MNKVWQLAIDPFINLVGSYGMRYSCQMSLLTQLLISSGVIIMFYIYLAIINLPKLFFVQDIVLILM